MSAPVPPDGVRPTAAVVLGVGVDIVDVERVARVRRGARDVMDHVCAPEERPAPGDDLRAACLWAGKEAVAKTLGTGFWQSGIDWLDIRIGPRAEVTLHGAAATRAAGSTVDLDFVRRGPHVLAVAIRRGPRP
jgi:phosphopantetheinyl transferase (holo-ACP synthase)